MDIKAIKKQAEELVATRLAIMSDGKLLKKEFQTEEYMNKLKKSSYAKKLPEKQERKLQAFLRKHLKKKKIEIVEDER